VPAATESNRRGTFEVLELNDAMGLLKKKPDPISEKAQSLTARIAALEAEIKRLDSQLQTGDAPAEGPAQGSPRLRSTAVPHGPTVPHAVPPPSPPPARPAAPPEPIFEADGQEQLKSPPEAPITPQHFNELGVRKYDLAALFVRFRSHFTGPQASNPKLVNLLAAGSVQGLRPLRYEKRVHRRRFLLFVGFLLLVLLGILAVFLRNH
jgi:cell division protein FtsB